MLENPIKTENDENKSVSKACGKQTRHFVQIKFRVKRSAFHANRLAFQVKILTSFVNRVPLRVTV